jgi:hypothetical protein
MSGADLFGAEQSNTPEAKAFIEAFDQDNGTVYCVPKMKDAQLGEFRAAMPGLIVKSVLTGMLGQQIQLDVKSPIKSMLRLALKDTYPCK